jgi:hypothetical protein
MLTGMIYCMRLWISSKETSAIRLPVQTCTAFLIIPFALFQLGSGFTMISLNQYDLSELWITGSIFGFIIVISSWFAFIYFLLQKKSYRKLQSILLMICMSAILCMIFFMANKIL